LRPSIIVAINDPSGFTHTRISAKKIAICNQPLAVMIFSRNSKLFRLQQRIQEVNAQRQRNHSGNQVFHIVPFSGFYSRSQAWTIIQATAKNATISKQ
jgi:hypothetical protein